MPISRAVFARWSFGACLGLAAGSPAWSADPPLRPAYFTCSFVDGVDMNSAAARFFMSQRIVGTLYDREFMLRETIRYAKEDAHIDEKNIHALQCTFAYSEEIEHRTDESMLVRPKGQQIVRFELNYTPRTPPSAPPRTRGR